MASSSAETDNFIYASLPQLMALEHRAVGLSFFARQPLSSILSGSHASRIRGRGLSFDELRRYAPGDDLRHLDWRSSLRFGKPFVRSFTEERDRPTLIVADQRMSMFFGSQRSLKSVTAAELAAICAWIAFKAGDRVGGLVIGDERIDYIRPLRSRARVEALFASIVRQNRALSATAVEKDAQGQLDLGLRQCLELAGHDNLICVISDFAGASGQTLKMLRELKAHNDVIALQVYDPLAMQLPSKGRIVVTQGELQVELQIDRKQVQKPLGEFLSGRMREVAHLLNSSQVPLMMLSTHEDSLVQLRRELGRLVEVMR
ncbi:DUF58 domain-containing protein [Pseudomonas sp. MS19]|uniref:DUF58 domain-containing protein n=1 Tax=Pseudomonas sp. MS19 TaxID=2579939 RepID=UPI001561B315|nr:DUF58 domain-containing protein [Pseudomonas sp. MS19]NRH28360.1 DUF58 domain-containing protein [Pseudomonas sp. MS19]